MRNRRWVLLVLGALVLIGPGLYLALRRVSEQGPIKSAIIAEITGALGDESSVGALDLGLSNITLRDVYFKLGERSNVWIEEVEATYSLGQLLRSGFDPLESVTRLSLDSPNISLYTDTSSDTGRSFFDTPRDLYFRETDFFISNGIVTVEETPGNKHFELVGLSLFGSVAGHDTLRFEGEAHTVAGDTGRFGFHGTFRGSVPELQMTTDLVNPYIFWPVPAVNLRIAGPSRGTGTLGITVGAETAMEIVGDVRMSSDSLRISDFLERVRALECAISFGGRDLSIEDCRMLFAGGRAVGGGDYEGFSNPDMDFSLRIEDAEVDRLATLAPALRNDLFVGTADLQVNFEGSPLDIRIHGTASSNRVIYGAYDFSDISGRYDFHQGRLELDDITYSIYDGTGRAAGSIDFVDSVDVLVNSRTEGVNIAVAVESMWGLGNIGGSTDVDLRISGSPLLPVVETGVHWDTILLGTAVEIPSGTGKMNMASGRLEYTGTTDDGTISADGEVTAVGIDPEISGVIGLSGLEPGRLVSDRSNSIATFDGNIATAGPLYSPGFAGRLMVGGNIARGHIDLNGTYSPGEPPSMRLTAVSDSLVLEGQRRQLELVLAMEKDTLELMTMSLGDRISARGSVGLRYPHTLKGTAMVESLELSELLELVKLPGIEDIEEGRVWLTTDLAGTVEQPAVGVQFAVREVSFRGTTGLELMGTAEIVGGELETSQAILQSGDETIATLTAEGPIGRGIRFQGRGSGLDLGILNPSLSGEFEFEVSSSEENARELALLKLASDRGTLGEIEFGQLMVSGAANRTFFDVFEFSVNVDDQVEFTGYGEVPYGFGEGEELGVELEARGDVLSLLRHVVPGVKDAGGEGEASILLVGTIGNLTAIDGSVRVPDGFIEPELFLDKMTNMDVEINFEDGILMLDRFRCNVGKGVVEAKSVIRPKRGDVLLEPLILSGIYVGGIGIKTERAPINVNIPDVMREGEWAKARVTGQGEDEYLYVAGTYEHPLILGRFMIENADFMLPDVEEQSLGPNSLAQRTEWDLEVVFGKGVWFTNPRADVEIQEGTTVLVLGSRYDGSLRPMGTIHARKGTLTFLGNDFVLEEGRVEFPRFEATAPRIMGKAVTRVEDGTEITLTLDTGLVDLETLEEETIWSEQTVQLSSDRPTEDDTQEKIWEKLLYGRPIDEVPESERFEFARQEVTAVMGQEVSERIVQPIIRPLEHRLKRTLRLDLLRIKVQFAKHVIEQLEWFRSEDEPSSYTPFLNDTGIAVGKYFSRDLFLSYEALVQNLQKDVDEVELGFRHELSMEYRLSPRTILTYTVRYRPDTETWESGPTIENRFRF